MIRYLAEAEVAALLPSPTRAIALARETLVGLAEGTIEQPPKPAIHPRESGFVNVMPAYLKDSDAAGLKIVAFYPDNRERGLPAIHGVVLVVDAETGKPVGLLGAVALTAARTAAASGACIERLAPSAPGHLAITGCGVEARSHLHVAAALGVTEIAAWDHRDANIEAFQRYAAEHEPAVTVRAARGPGEAADRAAIVVTGIPIGASSGGVPDEAVRADALVLPIDYSTSIAAETANSAALLAADDVVQQQQYVGSGHFEGWRVPDGPIGRWLAEDGPGRPDGRVVVANLGVGAHDVRFAREVLAAAERDGRGTLLDR